MEYLVGDNMDIVIGKNLFDEIRKFLSENIEENIFLITDENVRKYYLDKILQCLSDFKVNVYTLTPGEESKSLDIVKDIYSELIEVNCDRNTIIISFGGGVVGDISGFVASTYLRGVDYIQIPTTLLSQVDSSIGGKVGVDFKGYKNMIGSFYFPLATFIDIELLKSLDTRDITSGVGEVLKYGIIYDYDFLKYVYFNIDSIYNFDDEVLETIVKKSVSIKNRIVSQDKRDKGIRKILNFGHTIGHGIESFYDFKRYNHGEAVILGMIYESFISKEIGLIEEEYFNEIFSVLSKLVDPVIFNIKEVDGILKNMSYDKKNKKDKIVFVLPTDRGEVQIFDNIEKDLIKKTLSGDWIWK